MDFDKVVTLNNTYIVKFDKLTQDVVNVDGVDIKIDTRYNRQHHAQDIGTIACTTEDPDIFVGDTVVCQYLVVEDKNRLDEDDTGYYQLANRDQIFAVLRGNKIKMLDTYILVKPEEADLGEFEEVDGILRPRKEKRGRETLAKVIDVGDQVKNVKAGDRVRIHKSAQYPVEINGEKFYRVRSDVGLIYKYVDNE